MKKTKALQIHTEESLKQGRSMSTEQVVHFIEGFRQLHRLSTKEQKSKLISLKVPENLLQTFRAKAELEGTKYQTKIKKLMESWVKDES